MPLPFTFCVVVSFSRGIVSSTSANILSTIYPEVPNRSWTQKGELRRRIITLVSPFTSVRSEDEKETAQGDISQSTAASVCPTNRMLKIAL